MFEVIVRAEAVLLIAGSIGAFIYSTRQWLSIFQKTLLGAVIMTAGELGVFLLIEPAWIRQPFLIGISSHRTLEQMSEKS